LQAQTTRPVEPIVEQALDVATVWAGHPVAFALLTHEDRQYVAFYDADRYMTVGVRSLNSDQWQFKRLPSRVGWDSHNYVTMAVDARGDLHVAGNMHCDPLVYFRKATPGDIGTLERVAAMVGSREQRVTYPRFMTASGARLLFAYRDGRSGSGDDIYDVYVPTSKTWRRLIEEPLLSGEGAMNAYSVGPKRDKGGEYHLCWVWRDTPDCATNHTLSYARSRDLVHWENAKGEPLTLPITPESPTVVDPVPAGGGIINGNTQIGFDSHNRAILSYHKFDENGHTQLYNARFEDGQWRVVQATGWSYRWAFAGGGSIRFEIGVGPVEVDGPGRLRQYVHHVKEGSGLRILDEATLRVVGRRGRRPSLPTSVRKVESDAEGMGVRTRSDAGDSGEKNVRYVLRWETLGPNRDHPRDHAPPPSVLRLYEIRTPAATK
jgi:hypothetical protein